MTYLFRFSLVAIMMLTMAVNSEAQKFAYTSSQAILAELPDVKRANAKLESLQQQLQKKGQQMLTNYQTKTTELEARVQRGEVSQKQAEEEYSVLYKEQQEILKFEQEMMQTIAEKRQELLEPILTKIQKAIDTVAEEQGYQYVFDASAGVILYAKESDDITDAVKTKLESMPD